MIPAHISRRQWLTTAASAGLALTPLAHAQASAATPEAFPQGPIRFVIGAPPGGGTDVIARILTQQLATDTGRTFLVENKPGANGLIAADFVAKSAPDGQHIFIGVSSHQLLNQLLYTKMPLNLRTDLARIYRILDSGNFIAVNARTPVNNLQDLVRYIESNRGKLSFGSYGLGSVPHLLGERLNQITRGEMAHVPYKGEAPMLQELLSGELDIGWATVRPLQQHAGKLRGLATIGTQRNPSLPDLPTFAQGGLTDEAFSVLGWVGTAVSAKTPEPIKAALAEALAKVLAPEISKRFADMGFQVVQGDTATKFESYYQNDFAKWEKLVASVGVKLD